jgi:protein-disulfide isomerase
MRAFVPRRFRFAALAAGALALAGAALMPALTPAPATAQTLSGEERAAIEDVVRNYILENPEIIVEALDILQQREEMAAAQRQRQVIAERADQVFDGGSPFIGNPDGDVVLVEFFDYNCGYCRRAMEDIMRLVEADDGVRVVFKEFPVLGESSIAAAQVSIAVNEVAPEAYEDFHVRLMETDEPANAEIALALADEMGLPRAEIEAAMTAPVVQKTVEETYELANALGLTGTPSFVIGDEVIFGAVGYDTLVASVNEARCGAVTC